ncbi:MAG: cyclic pyranopterin monophosphate synthase MoaC [Hyphomonadaceae bacterium]|jgi:cyclic pyranopterin phosphate synthase|nr:cyclic pyranopterin monophosphate synthase MoaC [Hyphomonadaceae bacterium]
MKERLTHLDEAGRARMVDVGDKQTTHREAIAHGRIRMQPETLRRALAGDLPKGDVRAIAEIAGVMAGKRTSDLIPLCHPLALTSLRVDVKPDEAIPGFLVSARARVTGQTGVEMEALTAVSVACLTLYDMLKALDRGMTIEGIEVAEKHGGASGSYVRTQT